MVKHIANNILTCDLDDKEESQLVAFSWDEASVQVDHDNTNIIIH